MASEGDNPTILGLIIQTGNPIGREELFAYTMAVSSDEQCQLDLRRVNFDLDALCDVSAAAAGPERSLVTAVEKIEGEFAKAFVIKRKNGTEEIAKLPCCNVGPPMTTVDSEVAVLQYSYP